MNRPTFSEEEEEIETLSVARRHTSSPDTIILDLAGEATLATVAGLQEAVDSALDNAGSTPPVRFLVLNLTDLYFMDSAGLAAVIGARRRLIDERQGAVRLYGASGMLARTLLTIRMDALTPMFPSEEEAVAGKATPLEG